MPYFMIKMSQINLVLPMNVKGDGGKSRETRSNQEFTKIWKSKVELKTFANNDDLPVLD